MLHRITWLSLILPLLVLSSPAPAAPQMLDYEVLREADHDPRLFTQGLLVQGKLLVETSGGYGQSVVRRYRIDDGKQVSQQALPREVFAEGVAQVNDELLILTWREGILFRMDAQTLAPKQRARYDGEGWGLAYDGRHLFMSDGSSRITLRDPKDFSVRGELLVRDDRREWDQLNELEYAQGILWANRWKDHRIFAIDPSSGRVRGILDLGELVARNSHRPGHTVLNGIAYDPTEEAFWVTGKLWPRRYLIRIERPDGLPRSQPAPPPQ